jgi:hypothetical protein
MGNRRVSFKFDNHLSPYYVEPLLLQIETDTWYTTTELQQQLRDSGLDVQGQSIILTNINYWDKMGLGEKDRQGPGRSSLFRLGPLGKRLRELYSTNRALFFDIMHYLLYSAWRRSHDISLAPFWLYAEVCDTLWHEAPGDMDAMELTSQLQYECRQTFPEHDPTFPERSVRAIFPWLRELSPPFLSPCSSNRAQLCSERRRYCTPQLFHLAVDLAYHESGLAYGTSLAIDDRQIAAISRTCLLDPGGFWDMASLANMGIREFEVRQGQWGTSLALTGPPRWIDLPDFAEQQDAEDEEEEL